ncbi:cilia- and flagella-associated protein 161 isoform X3 [Opisthocomus hoazin]|uniref:cilia- and flagella-associated protein 161 isoform X3 n=1 Tax=Opisthocomus hoazin TaxID=30419 RepID=UPI003F534AFF
MAAYSPGVLIGNWAEEALREEDRLRDFMRKRERGELLIQKINKMQDKLLKKIQLSVSKDGFVHFGDTVMLLNPVNESRVGNGPGTCGSLALAASLGETWPCAAGPPPAPREVSAVESTDPVGRNAFCVLSVDGVTVGEPIRFGQNFRLGTTGAFSDQMANTKIIITHCYTNRSLAVPRNFWTRSYFGKEYEVICHTYLDSHKAEEDKNHWEVVTGNHSDEDRTMIDRPDPRPEGDQKEGVL